MLVLCINRPPSAHLEVFAEANDHGLAAAVLAHRSFVPGFAGDRAAATPLLDAAHTHARYAGGPERAARPPGGGLPVHVR